LKVWPPKEKAVQYQCQEHVVGVVGERRRQEGEVAGDARVGAGDATRRIEDRVGRAAAIVAGLRQHLHGAALDRSRAADIDAVGLARRIGLDLVGRARHLDVGAVHGQQADRVAGRQGARVDHVTADRAVAAQGPGRTHRDVASDAAVHRQGAGQHRGATGVGIVAGEVERAQALLAEAAGASDLRRQRGVGAAVGRERAGAQRDRAAGARQRPHRLGVAVEVERAAIDRQRAAREERCPETQLQGAGIHRRAAAIGAGAGQDQRAAARHGEAAGAADGAGQGERRAGHWE
jgi:hypothetical protein